MARIVCDTAYIYVAWPVLNMHIFNLCGFMYDATKHLVKMGIRNGNRGFYNPWRLRRSLPLRKICNWKMYVRFLKKPVRCTWSWSYKSISIPQIDLFYMQIRVELKPNFSTQKKLSQFRIWRSFITLLTFQRFIDILLWNIVERACNLRADCP